LNPGVVFLELLDDLFVDGLKAGRGSQGDGSFNVGNCRPIVLTAAGEQQQAEQEDDKRLDGA
jgi:hypothetical protein